MQILLIIILVIVIVYCDIYAQTKEDREKCANLLHSQIHLL